MDEWLNLVLMMLTLTQSTIAEPVQGPLVLMVGMDAFRYDFVDRGQTPNFRKIIASGVKAHHVVNAFPTKSRPNWYTIMTGLYPESHGVVNNHVYDPKVTPDKQISLNASNPLLWAEAEPIWITNQRQGGSSCVFNFSFGGFVDNGGMAINYHSNLPHNFIMTKEKLVDSVVDLFANGSINFGLIYFTDVDHACHHHGPESLESIMAVEEMDRMAGYILEKLDQNNLLGVMNLLFVADHGQINVYSNQTVFLNSKVNPTLYYGYQDNPIYSIFPHKDTDIDTIVNQLKKMDHIVTYKKDTIPEEYHYRNNPRIPPILVMADVGWNVAQNESEKPYWKDTVGEHGYSNTLPQMWPFFVATGPAFRKGYNITSFDTIDIYSLVCHILRIETRPHNGSLENVKQLLADGIEFNVKTSTHVVLIGVIVSLLLIIILMSYGLLLSVRKMAKYRRESFVMTGMQEAETLLEEDDFEA